MSWSWSHTEEAYLNAKANLFDLPHEDLVIITAEIRAWAPDENGGGEDFIHEAYEEALLIASKVASEDLAEGIWSFMEKHRVCDNGGFNAHCCPFGCHTVSFDREDNDE